MDLLKASFFHPIFFVFIPFGIALVVHLLKALIFSAMEKKVSKEARVTHALISSLKQPLTFIIWISALFYALQIIELMYAVPQSLYLIQRACAIFAIAWFVRNFLYALRKGILEDLDKKNKAYDPTTVDAISKLVNVSIFIVFGVILLQNLGLNLSGILAFGGIGGLAISFAAKDLLANLFGALMIHWDRPFKVGDWIRSPDRDVEGTVEYVGWRLTRIRTFDKRPLYVPNSIFATISIENPQRMNNRRIKETIGVRYQDAPVMDQIIEKMRTHLKEHSEIDQRQILIINFNGFGTYSLDILVYTFTKTTNWVKFHEVKQKILLELYEIIRSCNADIAFPTSDIYLNQPKKG